MNGGFFRITELRDEGDSDSGTVGSEQKVVSDQAWVAAVDGIGIGF